MPDSASMLPRPIGVQMMESAKFQFEICEKFDYVAVSVPAWRTQTEGANQSCQTLSHSWKSKSIHKKNNSHSSENLNEIVSIQYWQKIYSFTIFLQFSGRCCNLRNIDAHLCLLQSAVLIRTFGLHDEVCWEGEYDGEDEWGESQVEVGVAGVKSDGQKGVDHWDVPLHRHWDRHVHWHN